MTRLMALLMMPMPSMIKKRILRMLGHEVHKTAYIGMAYLHVQSLSMGPRSFIGIGNIFTNLSSVKLGEGALINRWNRFTCDSAHNETCILVVGSYSAITLRHYFDVSGGIEIGRNSIIAGHRSTFFTHSLAWSQPSTFNYVKPVVIGDWCYVGSNVSAVPGFRIGDHCFVGMGSVLVGNLAETRYSLIAGSPAKVVKVIPTNSPYFNTGSLRHAETQ